MLGLLGGLRVRGLSPSSHSLSSPPPLWYCTMSRFTPSWPTALIVCTSGLTLGKRCPHPHPGRIHAVLLLHAHPLAAAAGVDDSASPCAYCSGSCASGSCSPPSLSLCSPLLLLAVAVPVYCALSHRGLLSSLLRYIVHPLCVLLCVVPASFLTSSSSAHRARLRIRTC